MNGLLSRENHASANNSSQNEHFFQRRAQKSGTYADHGDSLNTSSFFAPSAVQNYQTIQRKKNPSMPLHVQSKMERSFGQDFSNVQIHKNSGEAQQMNALAFTKGRDIHFASGQYSPDTQEGQRLIGHELTHVVQQKEGKVPVTHYENGENLNASSSLENEADKMGALAADGKQTGSHTSDGSISANVVQKYTKRVGSVGRKNGFDRLSDDGKLAVEDHGKTGFAEESMISRANAMLSSIHSIAEVEKLSDKADVPVPKTKGKTINSLTKFTIVDRTTRGELELTDDCGTANQEVMGSGHYGTEKFTALYGPGNALETSSASYHGDDNAKGGIVSTTEEMSGEIYIDIFKTEYKLTLTREEALKKWSKLKRKEKNELSKKYNINQFAAPEMGQGITIGSERDMPGSSRDGYNFHFGFSLMKSGDDYITLEDYASSDVAYYLDMYGPESKHQAWAQDSGNTGALDSKNTTMVIKHSDN